MATDTYYFTGECKWAMVHKMDEKYGNYKINLYMDKASKDSFKKSGLQLKPKKEVEGSKPVECKLSDPDAYVTFRRPHSSKIKDEIIDFGKPRVLGEDGAPTNALIGNGSQVTVKVSAFDTMNGVGHRLEAVKVNNLVEYEGKSSGETVLPEGMEEIPF
jgi:hypothetical protein